RRRQEGGSRRFKEMPRHDQRETPPVSLDSRSGTSAGRLGTEGPRRVTLITRMSCHAADVYLQAMNLRWMSALLAMTAALSICFAANLLAEEAADSNAAVED